MAAAQDIKVALSRVQDLTSLVNELLGSRGVLQWPIDEKIESPEKITFTWNADELRAQGLEKRLLDGEVRQVRPFRPGQPWGIFLVEFTHDQVYRTALRQVLRGLVPNRRRNPSLQAWHHEHLLFICTTKDYDRFTFAHFRGDKPQTAKLVTFGWQKGDRHLRTACEFNLPALAWPEDGAADDAAWLAAWAKAFDKEPLTKDFFKRFDKAIAAVQADLMKVQGFDSAEAYSRAQLLLERLVFLYFLQNRGWLDQARDFLLKKFQEHRGKPNELSYYQDFLESLFWTLSSAPGEGGRLTGIPFLNGGLFDDDEFAQTPVRKKNNPPLMIRNATFAAVFDDFLEAFNFTVREDTPLDQDVAVDPEMLGKVFESIVLHAEAADPDAVAPDKRKATGSYYTPRIVVHFICREALQQYLQRHLPGDGWGSRLKELLPMDASQGLSADQLRDLRRLLTPKDGVLLRDRLRDLKCCDPAVGSGAFPVGLLHELVNLRRLAETAANGYVDPVRQPGTSWLHDAKEDVVQNCLFGVDIQQQAIEICRLRLWLSLVVDYDIGLDPFTAERGQFLAAIGRISQLPNLEMNFHRGDSLLDLISDVPVRIEVGGLGFRKKQVNDIQKLCQQLYKATKSGRKKELRVEILRRRLALTEEVLAEELEGLKNKDSTLASTLFGEIASETEKRRRLAHEGEKIEQALAKVQADCKQLEKLAAREFDSGFLPKLRRLEGADFNSPFNFAWRLDFAGIFSRDEPGFDIIVGNPPFVTARNPVKRELYRERWKRVCHMKFLLVCPFFDLSFGLLRQGAQLGFIVSNAFAKREFGQPLVEDFFPTVDLQKVVDCSGLMFPGHGTPTCIVLGANRVPDQENPVRVAALLPGGGDLRTPPEESPLWQTLEQNHDNPGFEDSQVAVADRERKEISRWPWSFDLGAAPTRLTLERQRPTLLNFLAGEIGFDLVTGSDEFFVMTGEQARRLRVRTRLLRKYYTGVDIRNWALSSETQAVFPYEKDCAVRLQCSGGFETYATRLKGHLDSRIYFGKTPSERGMKWWEYAIVLWGKRKSPLRLAFSQIATHAHFVRSESSNLFKEKAPIIKLPDSAQAHDYDLLAGLLNASTALFWLKQVCFNKGAGEDEHRDRFEFAGNKVDGLPVPECVAGALREKANTQADRLTTLSRACWERSGELASASFRLLFQKPNEAYHDWNSELPGHVLPATQVGKPFKTDELRAAASRVTEWREQLRAEVIARQEEMDWLVYAAYGLIPDAGPALPDSDLSLQREDRPYCLWGRADGDFAKAVALVPANWSPARRTLWKQRLETIRDNEHIRRIEQPVYKRRWDEQWKIGNRWECGQPAYDAEFLDAFDWWLSEKAEWWLEQHAKPAELDAWADALWTDPRVQAAWTVAAETSNRLETWKQHRSDKPTAKDLKLDASKTAFAKHFKSLMKSQSVPDNIPWAVPWEELEKKMKVPAAVKALRGKLNVPRERFRVTAAGLFVVARPVD